MSDTGIDPERSRYIIAAPALETQSAVDLAQIAAELQADPNAELVRAAPEDRPERLIVKMTPQRADALKARFGNRLIVELDAPLKDPRTPFNIS